MGGFLFTPELREKIILEEKTETRRVKKPGETIVFSTDEMYSILTASYRLKWREGRDYAIPYGRGKHTAWYHIHDRFEMSYDNYLEFKDNYGDDWENAFVSMNYAPLRIKVVGLWDEDVRSITPKSVKAEGFKDFFGFAGKWMYLNDRKGLRGLHEMHDTDAMRNYLWNRPDEHYDVWGIRFGLLDIYAPSEVE